MKWIILSLWGSVILLSVGSASAATIPVQLSVDTTTVGLGDRLNLTMHFSGQQQVTPPELPQLPGFRAQYLGQATNMSIVNGQARVEVSHRYGLIAVKEGEFTLGPYEFSSAGNRYVTDSVTVQVVSARSPPQSGVVDADSSPVSSPGDRLFMEVSVPKDTCYINERFPLVVKLYVADVNVSKVEFPVVSGEGWVKDDFVKSRQYKELRDGIYFEVIEFTAQVYPTRSGVLQLGPTSIRCLVSVRQRAPNRGFGNFFLDDSMFEDFFGRSRQYVRDVTAEPLSLTVSDFPVPDKPAGFQGAVGDFSLSVKTPPQQVRAGDPITLEISVTGTGNVESITAPVLADAHDFKVYQPEVTTEAEGKRFLQVIIPEKTSLTEIPAVQFSYLSPERNKYVTVSRGPFPLLVDPAAEPQAGIVEAKPVVGTEAATAVIGHDIQYIKERIGRVGAPSAFAYRRGWFWPVQALPVLGLLLLTVWQRRRERLQHDSSYAQALRAPRIARTGLQQTRTVLAGGDATAFYNRLFKTAQEYLGHRFHLPWQSITAAVVEELMRAGKIPDSVAAQLRQCFEDCDQARYSAVQSDPQLMRHSLQVLEQAIDYLERHKS